MPDSGDFSKRSQSISHKSHIIELCINFCGNTLLASKKEKVEYSGGHVRASVPTGLDQSIQHSTSRQI